MNAHGVEAKPEPDELTSILEGDVKPIVPFPGPFGRMPFTAAETARMAAALNTPLSRAETSTRPGPGGCRLTYVEGWRAIYDANQIFGFNGWSSKVLAIDVRYVEETAAKRFNACVCATVRITLRDGCIREDRGGGVCEGMRSKGDALLKAEKEAVTDATKRALKNFGLRLGLSLYDRQHVREMNRVPVVPSRITPPPNRPEVARIHAPSKSARTPVVAKTAYASPVTPAMPRRPVADAAGADVGTKLPMTRTPTSGAVNNARNGGMQLQQNAQVHPPQNAQMPAPQNQKLGEAQNGQMNARNGAAQTPHHLQGQMGHVGGSHRENGQNGRRKGRQPQENQVQRDDRQGSSSGGRQYYGNVTSAGMKRPLEENGNPEARRKARAAMVQKEIDELNTMGFHNF